MSRRDGVLERLCIARGYTEDLVDNIELEDWFRQPAQAVTHVAWQVGHLAVAEYYLALKRIRGQCQSDADLIPDEFFALFGKGSVPDADPKKYPSCDEIRQVFAQVHQQAVDETKALPDAVLDELTDPPHAMFRTKLGALNWCAQHEMLHAGQIGLLRRLLGSAWLR
jgi:hypothetical protein